jgi:hypothetical protein
MNDPIVDEVRRAREAYAARFNYELDAIFADLKEQERRSGLTFVGGIAKRARPNQSPQPTGPAIAVSDNSQPTQAGPAAER